MTYKNTLLSFAEDVENRSFWDWVRAHTSFLKPLYRYEGVLDLDGGSFKFLGREKDSGEGFELKVELEDVEEVSLGFDDVFTAWEDRAAPWNKPLKISYKDKNDDKSTVYLFVNFHHKWGMRTSDNKEVFEKILDLKSD